MLLIQEMSFLLTTTIPGKLRKHRKTNCPLELRCWMSRLELQWLRGCFGGKQLGRHILSIRNRILNTTAAMVVNDSFPKIHRIRVQILVRKKKHRKWPCHCIMRVEIIAIVSGIILSVKYNCSFTVLIYLFFAISLNVMIFTWFVALFWYNISSCYCNISFHPFWNKQSHFAQPIHPSQQETSIFFKVTRMKNLSLKVEWGEWMAAGIPLDP